ncbi:hypothetical protein [Hymenobacter negativus]|nr:hypothetical protein [Hymenobacter negativus]
MGLFDFLKPTAPPTPAPAAPAEAAEPYLGDLAKTNELYHLVAVPKPERDEAWDAAFLANVSAASFRCGSPQIIQGPDGFPYFQLFLPEPGVGFQCYVIERMKDDFLLERGLGVVINPTPAGPDWVLSYGDIVNFALNQEFYTTEETPFSKELSDELIEGEEQVMVGQPNETLLPQATRNVLREYLQNNGIATPKIVLLMRHRTNGAGISQDLVFNITPHDFGNETLYRSVMQQIGWFLPRHYSFVGMHEEALPDSFLPL